MAYLMWYEDNKKTTVTQRVQGGIDAYKARYGCAPSVVLVGADDFTTLNAASVDGVPVDSRSFIRVNNYWIGLAE